MGRKSLFLLIDSLDIRGWNLIEQQPVSLRQILTRNPFLNYFSPGDLVTLFWGIPPVVQVTNVTAGPPLDFTVQFEETAVGRFVRSAVISDDQNRYELTFQTRTLGQRNEYLFTRITGRIPWDR